MLQMIGSQYILTGIYLVLCAYTDIRFRYIDWKAAAVITVLSAAIHLSAGTADTFSVVLSLIPGSCCFMVSFLTKEGFGYGDSLSVLVCGVTLGMEAAMELLMMGLGLAAVWAMGLCLLKKADGKSEFPFIPFLLASFVILCLTG